MELQELEFDHNVFSNRTAADSKLHVQFFHSALPDPEASASTGIRKFRDVEMVSIIVPGDKRNIVVREARQDDKERFAKIYEAFKKDQDQTVQGFPLKEWSLVTRAMVEELKYLGFVTVEQVAGASDSIAGKYPGFRELQNRAKNWLESQASAAPLERLQAELKTRDEQLAAMQAQINELVSAGKAKKA
jgi:hypothetical protein